LTLVWPDDRKGIGPVKKSAPIIPKDPLLGELAHPEVMLTPEKKAV